MDTHQRSISEKQFGRVYEYDDAYVVALDVRGVGGEVTVDTVGKTAIVVAEDDEERSSSGREKQSFSGNRKPTASGDSRAAPGDGDDVFESELDLPGEADRTTVNNGVLTIEIPK